MSRTLIRHMRLFCASPDAMPVRHRDGILAVAGVLEQADLARLLLVDMERLGRNYGASVTAAIQRVAPVAHRMLIGGFGIALADTLVVELDGSGAFDRVCGLGDGMGMRQQPLFCMHRNAPVLDYRWLADRGCGIASMAVRERQGLNARLWMRS